MYGISLILSLWSSGDLHRLAKCDWASGSERSLVNFFFWLDNKPWYISSQTDAVFTNTLAAMLSHSTWRMLITWLNLFVRCIWVHWNVTCFMASGRRWPAQTWHTSQILLESQAQTHSKMSCSKHYIRHYVSTSSSFLFLFWIKDLCKFLLNSMKINKKCIHLNRKLKQHKY